MWDQNSTLEQELLDSAHSFEFFEAARIAELICDQHRSLRFRTSSSKGYPAGEVADLQESDDGIEIVANVIGLFGPAGVLPHADKDIVSGGDPNEYLRGFLDVFNERVIRLFYDAWKLNRIDVSFEMFQRKVHEKEDSAAIFLLSLCGLGIPTVRNQRLVPDDFFSGMVGQLCGNTRSANSIARCVAVRAGVPASLREFVKETISIPSRLQTRLGVGESRELGRTASVGSTVASHRNRFEIRLGPLSKADLRRLSPHDPNSSYAELVDLVRAVMTTPYDFDFRFVVEKEAVSRTQLGSSCLGFDSWVLAGKSEEDRDDPVKRYKWQTATT